VVFFLSLVHKTDYHKGEEIVDEDEFHIEPNSHCNAGLKNAVDSVSPWPSVIPGATFMKMGTGGTMSTVGSQSPPGKPALHPISTSSPASTPGHGHNKAQRRGMSFSTDLRDRPLRQKLWVGTLGTRTDDWSPALREKVEKKLRDEHENQVVWVEDGVFEGAYDEFCHQVSRTRRFFLPFLSSKRVF
jgi:trehalose-6-phosphate synthase